MIRRIAGALVLGLLCAGEAPAGDADQVLPAARALADGGDRPAAVRLLEEHLAAHPGSRDARYLAARLLSFEREWQRAQMHYDALLAFAPDDPDYLLGKAQVLVWQGRPADALPPLHRLRARHPDYLDAWRLELAALADLGDAAARARVLAEARRRFPGEPFPEPDVAARTSLQLGLGFDHLSRDRDPWRTVAAGFSHDLGSRRWIDGAARAARRFREHDRDLRLGAGFDPVPGWAVSLQGSAGPGNAVLPRWSLRGTVQRDLPHGWNLQLGAGASGYSTSRTRTVAGTLERYWSHWRTAYTLSAVRLGGETAYAHRLQLQRFYGLASSISLSAAAGDEPDFVRPGVFASRQTRTLALYGRHWLGNAWGVTWAVEREQVERAFTRQGVFLGVAHRF